MIVSEKHKYVFLQFPHTGCTAVGNELVQNYDGEELLEKHSMYHDFVRWAGPRAGDFFVFSSIRNPMDEAVSFYEKLRTNHLDEYTKETNYTTSGGHLSAGVRKRFDFIQARDADFVRYFLEFYRTPYVSWSVLAHHKLDFVMRFETLQDDFSRLLSQMGVERVRPLPVVNKTAKQQQDFWAYFTPEIRERAAWVFGPICRQFGYEFPEEWGLDQVAKSSLIQYRAMKLVKTVYWKYILPWNARPTFRGLIQFAVSRFPQ